MYYIAGLIVGIPFISVCFYCILVGEYNFTKKIELGFNNYQILACNSLEMVGVRHGTCILKIF